MIRLYYAAYMTYRALTVEPEIEICSMDDSRLKEQLRRHEGVKRFPYVDSVGKMTVGVGRNLSDRGISMATMEQMLTEDIELATSELDKIYPDWCELSENRQLVLANMTFNLGAPRYLTFEKFWAALRQAQYELAASEMMDSRWARQVGERAVELSELMKNG